MENSIETKQRILKWCEDTIDTDDYIPFELWHKIFLSCEEDLKTQINEEFFISVFREWIDNQEDFNEDLIW